MNKALLQFMPIIEYEQALRVEIIGCKLGGGAFVSERVQQRLTVYHTGTGKYSPLIDWPEKKKTKIGARCDAFARQEDYGEAIGWKTSASSSSIAVLVADRR